LDFEPVGIRRGIAAAFARDGALDEARQTPFPRAPRRRIGQWNNQMNSASLTLTAIIEVTIVIGGVPIIVRTESPEFAGLLKVRYGSFIATGTARPPVGRPVFELDVELAPPPALVDPDEGVRVSRDAGRWVMERGDFRAEWDPESGQGWVRQAANPYSLDTVLRILHTLILAREGGFLVHAASAVRNGRAFLFAGVSGAGKTTISRLAPPDVQVLTDEISYVQRVESGYEAFGTPFAGELARVGENIRAPLAGLYLLSQGSANCIETVGDADAARAMLESVLFFAQDAELVKRVFQSALDFVSQVPVRRLVFLPDARAWELIV
jgi:hypothetical protein